MATLEKKVARIIEQVKRGGDAALLRLTAKYDHVRLAPSRIRVRTSELDKAIDTCGTRFRRLVGTVAGTIASYHRRQLPRAGSFSNAHGATVGWLWRPVERAGIYVPGGSAPLVSTVLMTVVPARAAGVRDTVVCTPPGDRGEVNGYLLAACGLLRVRTVCRVGGAQAIAAMAFGTRSVPQVDVIAGPGNRYVTEAKRQLYGRVGIDMTAGPSEVAIIADGGADAAYIAADILSQAEHDPSSRAVLLTTSRRLIDEVKANLTSMSRGTGRRRIAGRALRSGLRFIRCRSLFDAVEESNRIAPEHLEIMTRKPSRLIPRIRNAGAVFIGPASPTAIGDYVAGPSHVLPTGGTARFFSGLSVGTFMRRVSLIRYNTDSLWKAAPSAERLAAIEGLEAHAAAIRIRSKESARGKSNVQRKH